MPDYKSVRTALLALLFSVWLAMPTAGFAQDNYYLVPENTFVEPLSEEEFKKYDVMKEESLSPEIAYRLAWMHFYGDDMVKEDVRRAEKIIIPAAKAGDEKSMLLLVNIYESKGDVTRALQWLHNLAKAESADGLYRLGEYYESGNGVFQDYNKARKAYSASANRGKLNALIKLGIYYQYGRGVEKDYKKAIAYFEKAEEKGTEQFKLKVALLLAELYADIADKEDSSDSVFYWKLRAAELFHIESQMYVADAYFGGNGVEQNYEKAIEWYKKAAKNTNLTAMTKLGYIYTNGLGVDIDYDQAAHWYTESAERGDSEAAWNLGNLYLGGYGVPRDPNKAEIWFQRAKVLRDPKTKRRFR
jgi:hypothetical protein